MSERPPQAEWAIDGLTEREADDFMDAISTAPVQRTFTADEVIEIANETSDSFGNLYRLDFIDRIRHEAGVTP